MIGLGIGLIVLDLLFYFSVLGPTKRAYTTRRTFYDDVKKTLAQKRIDVARLDDIRSHLNNASGNEAVRFDKYLWNTNDGFSSLIQFCSDTAGANGVLKGRTTFKTARQSESGLLEVKIELPLEGTYADVVKFINALERSDHLLIIDAIALQSGQDNPGLVRLNLSMLTYLKTV